MDIEYIKYFCRIKIYIRTEYNFYSYNTQLLNLFQVSTLFSLIGPYALEVIYIL